MRNFEVSNPTISQTLLAIKRARIRWGLRPLPAGAELVGEYRDDHRMGAAMRLANGSLVCGAAGCIGCIPSTTALLDREALELEMEAAGLEVGR